MRAPIPERILGALQRYVEDRIQPGGFMTAVLSNDLREAIARADDECLAALHTIVARLYNDVPSICWGSPEKVDAWLDGAA